MKILLCFFKNLIEVEVCVYYILWKDFFFFSCFMYQPHRKIYVVMCMDVMWKIALVSNFSFSCFCEFLSLSKTELRVNLLENLVNFGAFKKLKISLNDWTLKILDFPGFHTQFNEELKVNATKFPFLSQTRVSDWPIIDSPKGKIINKPSCVFSLQFLVTFEIIEEFLCVSKKTICKYFLWTSSKKFKK